MQESILGLVGLLKEKTIYKEDLQAKTVHKALQQVLGKQNVSFQLVKQEQALYTVLDNHMLLVIVLLTRGGKSLLFTLLACIKEGVTVVIVLYQALIKDLVKQICNCSVDYIE
jgi:superfamily II DNA helicase RecQ